MRNVNGFVKLHRKLLVWGWYSDCVVKDVFIHLLITAAWKTSNYMGHTIVPGQAIVGRKKMAMELGFSEQQIRTALKKLESTNEIELFTTNKFTIVTVKNWKDYQEEDLVYNNISNQHFAVDNSKKIKKSEKINQQNNQDNNQDNHNKKHIENTHNSAGCKKDSNQQNNQDSNNPSTNEQPTSNQQLTTLEEYKNIRIKEIKNIREAVALAPVSLKSTLTDFVEMRKTIKAPMTVKAIQLLVSKLDKLAGGDMEKAIAIMEQSIINSWKGVFPLKGEESIKKEEPKEAVKIDKYSINI